MLWWLRWLVKWGVISAGELFCNSLIWHCALIELSCSAAALVLTHRPVTETGEIHCFLLQAVYTSNKCMPGSWHTVVEFPVQAAAVLTLAAWLVQHPKGHRLPGELHTQYQL